MKKSRHSVISGQQMFGEETEFAFQSKMAKMQNSSHNRHASATTGKEAVPVVLDQSKLYLVNLNHLSANFLKLIQVLDISNNKIASWPDQIATCTQLKQFTFSLNLITEIPDSIGYNRNLQELVVSDNHISTVSEQITGLVNLQKLDISYNQLSELQHSICFVPNLQNLSIRGNPITSLGPNFARLVEVLEILTLDWFKYLQVNLGEQQTLSKSMRVHLIELVQTKQEITIPIFMKSFNSGDTFTYDQWISAICSQDLGIVKFFAKMHPEFLNQTYQGYSPLTFAYKEKKHKSALLLLNYNPSLGLCGKVSLIEYIVLQMDFHFLEKLFQKNLVNSLQLHYQFQSSQNQLTKPLLNIVMAQFNRFQSASLVAQLLISQNVQLDEKDKDGFNCVHIASKFNQISGIKFIINHNNSFFNKNVFSIKQRFKVHFFKEHDGTKFKLSSRSKNDRSTPLHLAAQFGYLEIAYYLIEVNYEVLDVMKLDSDGQLAKHYTTFNGAIYKLILKQEKKMYKKLYRINPKAMQVECRDTQSLPFLKFAKETGQISNDSLQVIRNILTQKCSIYYHLVFFKLYSGNFLPFKANLKPYADSFMLSIIQQQVPTTMNTEVSLIVAKEDRNFVIPESFIQKKKNQSSEQQVDQLINELADLNFQAEQSTHVIFTEVNNQLKSKGQTRIFIDYFAAIWIQQQSSNLEAFVRNFLRTSIYRYYVNRQAAATNKLQYKINCNSLIKSNLLTQFDFFHCLHSSGYLKNAPLMRASSEQKKTRSEPFNTCTSNNTKTKSKNAVESQLNDLLKNSLMQKKIDLDKKNLTFLKR